LQKEIEEIEKAIATLLHVDIMDGKFVPPVTFDEREISALED